jgi:hypothetical protein
VSALQRLEDPRKKAFCDFGSPLRSEPVAYSAATVSSRRSIPSPRRWDQRRPPLTGPALGRERRRDRQPLRHPAGPDPGTFAGHSLRAGFLTSAAEAGGEHLEAQ